MQISSFLSSYAAVWLPEYQEIFEVFASDLVVRINRIRRKQNIGIETEMAENLPYILASYGNAACVHPALFETSLSWCEENMDVILDLLSWRQISITLRYQYMMWWYISSSKAIFPASKENNSSWKIWCMFLLPSSKYFCIWEKSIKVRLHSVHLFGSLLLFWVQDGINIKIRITYESIAVVSYAIASAGLHRPSFWQKVDQQIRILIYTEQKVHEMGLLFQIIWIHLDHLDIFKSYFTYID